MKICCPDCQFTSEMQESALPKRTAIATCPQCGCRFRFSPTEGVLGKLEPKAEENEPEQSQPETSKEPPKKDDPLPEGAIVIRPGAQKSAQSKSRPSEDLGEGRRRKIPAQPTVYTPRDSSRRRSSNPWDRAPGRIGWFSSFYQTCLRVMFVPQRFFGALSTKVPFYPALIFFLIICVIEFVTTYCWVQVLLSMLGSQDPQIKDMLNLLAPQGNVLLRLLLQTAFGAVNLYIVSGLFYVVLRFIAPDTAEFTLIYQVIAYSAAPTLLCIVPIAGSLAGMLWTLACMAIGLRTALRLTWLQTCSSFLPMLLLLVLLKRLVALVMI
ncbi:MAG: hypothetical protein IJU79_02740 [Desulfovibrionaceae bacterium]|nr:hypothetical protein [Desulfovibrionaceae bacterium]